MIVLLPNKRCILDSVPIMMVSLATMNRVVAALVLVLAIQAAARPVR